MSSVSQIGISSTEAAAACPVCTNWPALLDAGSSIAQHVHENVKVNNLLCTSPMDQARRFQAPLDRLQATKAAPAAGFNWPSPECLPIIEQQASDTSSTHSRQWPPEPPQHPPGGLPFCSAPPPDPSHFQPLLPSCGSSPHSGTPLLTEPLSMIPRCGDPDSAHPVSHADGENVSVARFEFRRLEFEKPSRMVSRSSQNAVGCCVPTENHHESRMLLRGTSLGDENTTSTDSLYIYPA